ncbi:MAG: hypothetical protein GY861_17620 [bacterium]|nr:hypothetical protein [bacterium]
MKEVNDFKKQNGNVNYTVKELVGGVHVKLDEGRKETKKELAAIKEDVGELKTDFAVTRQKVKSQGKMLYTVVPLFITGLAGLLALILKLTGHI